MTLWAAASIREYAFMRTTVDLRDPLMRAAKARAAEAGESLKTLFERAVIRDLGAAPGETGKGEVDYPLIRSRRVGVDFTNEQVEEMLADDEVERYTS
ncbi:hypothetical protein GCM10025883_33580 [Mobilicoccus caccae]|uniref:Uncharacterized protein n=2 Tax=Mobilicoccus caccae TaxID=1859295 RepID=A0ABQ6IXB3_9MICO|nr:hypothetical protein GCM10025883_33580 [Mobilicoccus caccae]